MKAKWNFIPLNCDGQINSELGPWVILYSTLGTHHGLNSINRNVKTTSSINVDKSTKYIKTLSIKEKHDENKYVCYFEDREWNDNDGDGGGGGRTASPVDI